MVVGGADGDGGEGGGRYGDADGREGLGHSEAS